MPNKIHNLKTKNIFMKWSSFYILLITILIEIIAYISFNLPLIVLVLTCLTAILFSIFLWQNKLCKRILYWQNFFNVLGAISLGGILSIIMAKITYLFFAYIVYVAVLDIFNFTKKGSETSNAKLCKDTNTLSRLSICLPFPKYTGLFPIIGIGDLSYFSLITFTSIKIYDLSFFKFVLMAILLGQLLNILVFIMFSHKKWYKGIPATAFPALFFIITVLLKSSSFML